MSKDGEQQIWIPMLNAASKGKDLVEKYLLVLGGSPEQQREFLEQINTDDTRSRFNNGRNVKKVPISNHYTLGYTYHDIQDVDGEGMLARLNIHMLSNPSASFAPLLKPLLSAKTVKDTLVTILLDWSDPFKWARQMRQWIRLLRSVILTLDDETKIAMEENMTTWKEKRLGPDGSNPADSKSTPVPPLGPGEWDEGLGVPLSVVCVQSEKVEALERDQGWHDEQFDFLTQWLRCVLLKHGSSLIYTASFDPNSLRILIHSSLSIQSLLKKDVAKPNYIERDKILIPANWDSWGKIRPLREDTDLEAISDAWSIEIQGKAEEAPDFTPKSTTNGADFQNSAVSIYESNLPHPTERQSSYSTKTDDEEVTVPSVQEFLQSQFKVLEILKEDDEKAARKARKSAPAPSGSTATSSIDESSNKTISNPKMAEQIGPYQINVNGIDFDAEEATRRLRERENERSSGRSESRATATSGMSTPTRRAAAVGGPDDGKTSNEAMSAFFANLIKKDKRAGSGTVSPNRGSPAPERRLEQ